MSDSIFGVQTAIQTRLLQWANIFEACSDMASLAADLREAAGKIERRDATYTKPREGWVCFHCGERFLDYESAKAHFGEKPGDRTGQHEPTR